MRLVAPVLGAVLLTAATLVAAGEKLSVFHVVALLLVIGVGLNYALFFGRRHASAAERDLTLLSVAVAGLATLCASVMLALSGTPVLRAIGVTVGLGAVSRSSVRGHYPRAHESECGPSSPIDADHGARPRQRADAGGAARAAQRTGSERLRRRKLDTWTGVVDRLEAKLAARAGALRLPQQPRSPSSRCAGRIRDAVRARARALRRRSASALFIGTSSAGILQTELGYRARNADVARAARGLRYRERINLFSPPPTCARGSAWPARRRRLDRLLLERQGVRQPPRAAMAAGLCDAAVVGGVETLCLTTLYGFDSLELLSQRRAGPATRRATASPSAKRRPSRCSSARSDGDGDGRLLGYGESADAHHMSTPHPRGRRARAARCARRSRAAGLAAGTTSTT